MVIHFYGKKEAAPSRTCSIQAAKMMIVAHEDDWNIQVITNKINGETGRLRSDKHLIVM